MIASAAPAGTRSKETLFEGSTPSSWLGLLILVLIGLYMFSDRQIVTLQTDAIKASLGLSDFQIGLVQGVSVALFTAVVGYPIGWLADRFDRRYVLAVCILIWSGSLAASGLARDFQQLFIASAIVGAGEAGLLPITYALVPELFKGRSRILANSMMVFVGRFASGVVIFLCGLLVQNVADVRPLLPTSMAGLENWRLALIITALPGVFIAFLVLLIPARAARPSGGAIDKAPSAPVWPFLSRNLRTFLSFYCGVGLMVFGTSAMGAFLPVVAMRQMGATAAEVGAGIGTATMISMIVAFVVTIAANKYIARLFGAFAAIRMLSISILFLALTIPWLLLASTPQHLYLILGIGFFFIAVGTMAWPTTLQELTPWMTRARLISIIILVNIVASALAPPVTGAISDQLKSLPNGLLLAITTTAFSAMALSAAMLFFCTRSYSTTLDDARAEDRRVDEADLAVAKA